MGFRLPLPIQEKYNYIQGKYKETRLIQYLLAESRAGNMSDAQTAAASMETIAAAMSSDYRCRINYVDVSCKVEELRLLLEEFIWFKALPGIQYDAEQNRVTVLPEYWERYDFRHKELKQNLVYRLQGEPNYALLHQVFIDDGVGRLDMQWIIGRCMGGDPRWMPPLAVHESMD